MRIEKRVQQGESPWELELQLIPTERGFAYVSTLDAEVIFQWDDEKPNSYGVDDGEVMAHNAEYGVFVTLGIDVNYFDSRA
jgi:hypothetical protein